MVYSRLDEFPVLYNRTLLFTHSKCKFASTNPKLPLHPYFPAPLASTSLISVCEFVSVL